MNENNNNQENAAQDQADFEAEFTSISQATWTMGWDSSALQEPSTPKPSENKKSGSSFPKPRAWAMGWDSSVLE